MSHRLLGEASLGGRQDSILHLIRLECRTPHHFSDLLRQQMPRFLEWLSAARVGDLPRASWFHYRYLYFHQCLDRYPVPGRLHLSVLHLHQIQTLTHCYQICHAEWMRSSVCSHHRQLRFWPCALLYLRSPPHSRSVRLCQAVPLDRFLDISWYASGASVFLYLVQVCSRNVNPRRGHHNSRLVRGCRVHQSGIGGSIHLAREGLGRRAHLGWVSSVWSCTWRHPGCRHRHTALCRTHTHTLPASRTASECSSCTHRSSVTRRVQCKELAPYLWAHGLPQGHSGTHRGRLRRNFSYFLCYSWLQRLFLRIYIGVREITHTKISLRIDNPFRRYLYKND